MDNRLELYKEEAITKLSLFIDAVDKIIDIVAECPETFRKEGAEMRTLISQDIKDMVDDYYKNGEKKLDSKRLSGEDRA